MELIKEFQCRISESFFYEKLILDITKQSLSVNKTYLARCEPFFTTLYPNRYIYTVRCDDGLFRWIPEEFIIPIEEHRETQLNKLLGENNVFNI